MPVIVQLLCHIRGVAPLPRFHSHGSRNRQYQNLIQTSTRTTSLLSQELSITSCDYQTIRSLAFGYEYESIAPSTLPAASLGITPLSYLQQALVAKLEPSLPTATNHASSSGSSEIFASHEYLGYRYSHFSESHCSARKSLS